MGGGAATPNSRFPTPHSMLPSAPSALICVICGSFWAGGRIQHPRSNIGTGGDQPSQRGSKEKNGAAGRQPREAPSNDDTIAATLSLREEFRVYLVQQGDSLWKIARRFDMNHRALATVNGLAISASLQIGRPLKVKAATSRELRLDLTSGPFARHPSLLEHIRMIDGRPVPRWLVTDYVAGVIDKRPPGAVNKGWEGRMKNLTIVIHFQLVKNLLEGRARKYHPMVLAHARKYNLDPALIMAEIKSLQKWVDEL